jgi:hypothetical protein
MSKITHHIPTESYGFTEVEMYETDFLSYEEAKSLYGPPGASQGQGLDPKEMNRCVEEYLSTGGLVNGTELYQQMSPSQQDWFQVTKRALKRLEAKKE